MTYIMMQERIDVGVTALYTALEEHLKDMKASTHWVPHSLVDEQKEYRVNWCQLYINIYISRSTELH